MGSATKSIARCFELPTNISMEFTDALASADILPSYRKIGLFLSDEISKARTKTWN